MIPIFGFPSELTLLAEASGEMRLIKWESRQVVWGECMTYNPLNCCLHLLARSPLSISTEGRWGLFRAWELGSRV